MTSPAPLCDLREVIRAREQGSATGPGRASTLKWLLAMMVWLLDGSGSPEVASLRAIVK